MDLEPDLCKMRWADRYFHQMRPFGTVEIRSVDCARDLDFEDGDWTVNRRR